MTSSSSSGGGKKKGSMSALQTQPSMKWLQLVNDADEVHMDLLDVNKSLLDELNRHSKAMSAIYTHHSETSSSDMDSGVSTPVERGGGGGGSSGGGLGLLAEFGYENSPIWEGVDNETEIKDVFTRTCYTGDGTPTGEGDGGGDDRGDDVLEIERFEKSIFVKAALQLLMDRAMALEERNRAQLEAGHQPITSGVIKVGFLKKANHHSMGTIWKTKLVELHPGLFVYEDDDSILGKRKKSIPLLASVCACRTIASRKSNVFELSLRKGSKRLWMCSSEEDRQEWMKAISDATLASAQGEGAMGALLSDSPYLQDMRRYKEMKESFEVASTRALYQDVVQQLHQEQICVPFSWVRGQIGEFFPMEALSRHGSGTVPGGNDLTQLWKDMMRDKVCINGQVIYGESGPDSILGALARSIVLLASKAREKESKLGLLSPSYINARPSSAFVPSTHHPSTSGYTPLCAMTEVQAVAHTMDILLACNRTQSGGDTYYCVEYLFRNPSLVVICPYSSHAEPLQVSLELIDEAIDLGPQSNTLLSDDECAAGGAWGKPHTAGETKDTVGGGIKERAWSRVTSVRLPGQSKQSRHGGSPVLGRSDSLGKFISSEQLPPNPPLPSIASEVLSKSLPISVSKRGATGVDIQDEVLECAHTGGEEGLPASLNSSVPNHQEESAATCQPHRSALISRPVIRVKIQANTSFKICPLDPQDDDEDIWSIVSARFEQNFVITGLGLTKSQELVSLRSVLGTKETGGSKSPIQSPTGLSVKSGVGGESAPGY